MLENISFMRIIILTLILLLPASIYAQEFSDSQIADAIKKTENSKKYPYGIKSINTYGNEAYARQICLNSIRKAKKRWEAAGKPEDFISYMGKRYAPPTQNPNWVRLVHYFLEKEAK